MNYKIKSISLRNTILISFTIIMTLTIFTISIFVKKTFQTEFGKYVDDSNKTEVEHLVFDLKNIYKDNNWDVELIEQLGQDAIKKGIALEIYSYDNTSVWSVFNDEQILSNEILSSIRENMMSIEENWNSNLKDYKINIYDENENIVGYENIIHYESVYYMENDMEFLSIINKFMGITSIISIGSIILISILISKVLSNSMEKVSKMAKVIEKGKYKSNLDYKSNIKEVDDLILAINSLSVKLNDEEILRKRLTTDIAHELRTPLTSIQGHLDTLIDGVWEPTSERLISIREEVSRLGDLVGELRKLSKFDIEKNILNKTEVNLKELIQNIIYNYESKALEKQITIESNLKDIFINVDKNQFSQVLINILSNAIKYTNIGGRVELNMYEDIDNVNISIKDTGCGIPKEDIKNIFERFYRVDRSRNKKTGGIGVGLTIAQSIINAHNGEIIVKSELNKGTEFIIKLSK
ncbi:MULTISPECIES: HAMP domain-containing sensor histidine kinase [unclassified Clostridium]|nr:MULTISPECIES: HAMP domain-containing sensor histidine kinase [unclassified Clostridium]MBY6977176.1 HAMP domain-containing histidine kinase [Clostridium botulinum]NFJ41712.1 HAMP domain-containing histidine kinase [Clostridium botulinum B str. Eklund 17B (NRP)]MBY6999332.1 HAMP domain-containing histidine kinase [Clostridium botulinum]MCR1272583.1 HAMP domain-containing histidine kinase [Clostridium botulinum]NFD70039.1 HAMP domain-containing histidine kinase [Clostridium botulinum]